MSDRNAKIGQALVGLCCAIVALRFNLDLDGTEFMGGRITGPLLDMQTMGFVLFFLALPLTFLVRRIAAAMLLLASLLSVPLYIYFIAPGPFRYVFPGNYKGGLQANFVWDWWSAIGMLAMVLVIVASVAGLHSPAARTEIAR
jgi:hypothetical protein